MTEPQQPDPYAPPPPGATPPVPTPPPYGQPAGTPPPYGEPAYGWVPPTAAMQYASWGSRVGALLLDVLIALPLFIVGGVLVGQGSGAAAAGGVVYLAGLVFALWNQVFRQGRTGQSLGKGWAGIRLIRERDGQPLGAGMVFIRQIAHVLDSLPFYLGYLWPLWDKKRQTFADKVMGSVVVRA